ncbi:hypothetical protein BB934_22365 [Microvirga ossetica]|uniref:Uncharacterized protein n=1 Tax=Microvirga ossetica TaxID=1882682 RepID=A0A1B2EKW5_9HYPH|nr:hypothetical protein [Microvirga ossetica]ANY80634.1 hypothetical protein BB934_22365 [Microvirga ossetica]
MAVSSALQRLHLTVFESSTTLSKRYSFDEASQTITKTASAQMIEGHAERRFLKLDRICIFALECLRLGLDELGTHQAIGLGILRDGVVRSVITTLGQLARMPEHDEPDVRARSLSHFTFHDGPGLLLIDNDNGRNTADLLAAVCPPMRGVASLTRAAMSASVIHPGLGLAVPSAGEHVYCILDDQRCSKEALEILHKACFVAGHGRIDLSRAGSFLQRSAVDRAVGSPERLVFEGRPIVESPLIVRERPFVARGGDVLRIAELRAWAEARDIAARYRECVIALESDPDLIERRRAVQAAHRATLEEHHRQAGMPVAEARRKAERTVRSLARSSLKSGVIRLDPDDVFVTRDRGRVSYRVMLADPAAWEGCTGFDPEEGESYGHCASIVYRSATNGLLIYSQAHGGRTFVVDPILTRDHERTLSRLKCGLIRARMFWPAVALPDLLQAISAEPREQMRPLARPLVRMALAQGLSPDDGRAVALACGCDEAAARILTAPHTASPSSTRAGDQP